MPAPALDVLAPLPHRYPLRPVGVVTEPGRRAMGIKRVTGGEWSAGARSGLGAADRRRSAPRA